MGLRILLRRLWKHRVIVGAVVIAAALPMAVNAALFTILDGLQFRELPLGRPEELVAVDYRRIAGVLPDLAYHPRLIRERDELRRRLEASPLIAGASQVGFASFFEADALGIQAIGVDSRFFQLLDLVPSLGHTFGAEHEQSPAALSRTSPIPLPVVVGYYLWMKELGGRPEAVGEVHQLGGRRVRVIGVMPAGVKFPHESNVWAPVSSQRGRPPAIVRLAAGASLASLASLFPELTFTPLRESIRPGGTRSIALLLLASTLLVLVAWVQVAALVWSGIVGRLRELGIGIALGATRVRLFGQLCIEGLVVALLVAAAAWLAATPITSIFVDALPESLRSGQYLTTGPRTLLFVIAFGVVGLIILALVPIQLIRRASPMPLLTGRLGDRMPQAARVRNGLLLGQVAITACLLYAAGLVVHSQVQAEAFDHGFDTDRVMVFWPPEAGPHPRTESEIRSHISERRQLIRASVDRLNASQAVTAAADVQAIRLTGLLSPVEESVTHFDGRRLHPEVRAWATGAGPAFLKALGGTLVQGRPFDDPGYAGRTDVVIVNETLARELSPPDTLLGVQVQMPVIGSLLKTAFFQGEIIGVAKDLVDSSPVLPARPQFFVPSIHPSYEGGTITVNVRPPVSSNLPVVRSILEEIWGSQPPKRFGLMSDELSRVLAPFRARSTLLSLVAMLCVPLAAIGLAGTLLYSVRVQARETAIRIALGGEPARIQRAVVAGALRLVGLGVLPGIALGAALGRVAAHELFGVRLVDPVSVLSVAGGLLLIGWLAALVPARRASEVRPADVLRAG